MAYRQHTFLIHVVKPRSPTKPSRFMAARNRANSSSVNRIPFRFGSLMRSSLPQILLSQVVHTRCVMDSGKKQMLFALCAHRVSHSMHAARTNIAPNRGIRRSAGGFGCETGRERTIREYSALRSFSHEEQQLASARTRGFFRARRRMTCVSR